MAGRGRRGWRERDGVADIPRSARGRSPVAPSSLRLGGGNGRGWTDGGGPGQTAGSGGAKKGEALSGVGGAWPKGRLRPWEAGLGGGVEPTCPPFL